MQHNRTPPSFVPHSTERRGRLWMLLVCEDVMVLSLLPLSCPVSWGSFEHHLKSRLCQQRCNMIPTKTLAVSPFLSLVFSSDRNQPAVPEFATCHRGTCWRHQVESAASNYRVYAITCRTAGQCVCVCVCVCMCVASLCVTPPLPPPHVMLGCQSVWGEVEPVMYAVVDR